MSNQTLHDAVMAALGTVIEPELHRDLVTLNMVRDLTVSDDGVAHFTIVLTTPACPLKDVMYQRAKDAVTQVDGITDVTITWDSKVPTDSRISSQINMPIKSIIAVSSGKGGVG
ncbi:MAG: DUF59 domain-containing protein, partial [Anaerolineae bacterium]|nr:DUF59 domain-containing protein [Anaerolineae bacterium]